MMLKKDGRLIFQERIQIEKLLSYNMNFSEIARLLNRNKSTFHREVRRL